MSDAAETADGEASDAANSPHDAADAPTDDAASAALDDEAVVLVGHGSRRERSNEQVHELAVALESHLSVPVDAAFVELAEPAIGDAIDGLAGAVDQLTVVPLALFGASHVKSDVPLAIQQARSRHPGLEIYGGAHLGVHPRIVDVLADRVAPVEETLGVDRSEADVAVLLCARGSSDPDANADVHKLARLLYEGREFSRVAAGFVGVTEPELPDALHDLARHRPDAIVVLPYMLGEGVLTQRVRDRTAAFDEEYAYVDAAAGDPLGTDDRLVEVLADRWQAARTDSVEMSCDTCKYKVELSGFEDDVGGARATVRALAHQAEHADRDDVDEEPHAHDAPDRHVAVCTNRTCADQGSPAVVERLRQAVRDDPDADVRISRSSCLGHCGDGPMVAVYPEGVWYGGVAPEDADRVADEHLQKGQIVSEFVRETL